MGEHPAEAERRRLGGPAPDVDHHVHPPFQRVDAAADGPRDRLVQRPAGRMTGLLRGLQERPVLERGGARRARPITARTGSACSRDRPRAGPPQVHPGGLQVGDHAVLQRPDGDEPGRCPAEQLRGLPADGEDPLPAAGPAAQQHDRRLVVDDAAADVAHDGVGSAQIDPEVHRSAS